MAASEVAAPEAAERATAMIAGVMTTAVMTAYHGAAAMVAKIRHGVN